LCIDSFVATNAAWQTKRVNCNDKISYLKIDSERTRTEPVNTDVIAYSFIKEQATRVRWADECNINPKVHRLGI